MLILKRAHSTRAHSDRSPPATIELERSDRPVLPKQANQTIALQNLSCKDSHRNQTEFQKTAN